MCAQMANPMKTLLDAAFQPHTWEHIRKCAHEPDMVLIHRLKGRAMLHQLATDLEPQRLKWKASLPEDSPVKNLNFPLIYYLADKLDFPDKVLVRELACGMPIAGTIPAVPTLTTRKRSAQCSMEDFKAGIPARNAANIERTRNDMGTRLGNCCYEKTMREVAAGWITTPIPLSQVEDTIPLTPRYAIEEERGNQTTKIRLIDDFRASGINATTEVEDTNVPDGLDAILALCSAFQQQLEGRKALICSVDFAHAYKHIPLPEDQAEYASIIFPGMEGEPLVGRLRTQPFGSSRAPANWARVTEFLKLVLGRLFWITLLVYVGDWRRCIL